MGFATSDDAAVYRISANQAVVETVDFFPPVVDDPFAFGQIAAANALSDIWAMGAKPLFALNLVGFPVKQLPLETLSRILAGGQSKADEAGIPILGGHSLDDPEPKYGLCVTGIVHPKRILRNSGARAGDALVLTKPLGSGIASTAIKQGKAAGELTERAVALMATLNKAAGEVFASGRFRVHALTDVTGFGLLGHLVEMMVPARLRARLEWSRVPLLEGVRELAEAGVVPGGTQANLDHFSADVSFAPQFDEPRRLLLADAQTNGGLLACIPQGQLATALAALRRRGVLAAHIGDVAKGPPGVDVLDR